jgi:hypothetical protein
VISFVRGALLINTGVRTPSLLLLGEEGEFGVARPQVVGHLAHESVLEHVHVGGAVVASGRVTGHGAAVGPQPGHHGAAAGGGRAHHLRLRAGGSLLTCLVALVANAI